MRKPYTAAQRYAHGMSQSDLICGFAPDGWAWLSATQQLYITDVEHETVVEVDEAGMTTAGAMVKN
jgi:hypothetical protein